MPYPAYPIRHYGEGKIIFHLANASDPQNALVHFETQFKQIGDTMATQGKNITSEIFVIIDLNTTNNLYLSAFRVAGSYY